MTVLGDRNVSKLVSINRVNKWIRLTPPRILSSHVFAIYWPKTSCTALSLYNICTRPSAQPLVGRRRTSGLPDSYLLFTRPGRRLLPYVSRCTYELGFQKTGKHQTWLLIRKTYGIILLGHFFWDTLYMQLF